MGPIALFDKSFLQSLSVDEAIWFDHFFFPVICPLFYIETLADLGKTVRQGRTPEQEVRCIAEKTPEMHGGPCVHHHKLCLHNLLGNPVPMKGCIPAPGGRPAGTGGKQGIVFDVSPEVQAFSRWQRGEFAEIERESAHDWRVSLAATDLTTVAAGVRAMGIDSRTCKSLEQAKEMADSLVCGTTLLADRMKLAFITLGVPRQFEQPILARWEQAGYPPLSVYAPFAAYVLTVEIFFQIALGAGLISHERASNRVDMAYLFYLPFCMLFVSSDRLHQRCAPLFMRHNQEFVWGQALKEDLKRLNDYYLALPDSEKETGIMKFAAYPPETGDYLVSQLWDRHLRPWRGGALEVKAKDSEKEKELLKYFEEFIQEPTTPSKTVPVGFSDVDALAIRRLVRKQRGSWWQLPKDLKHPDEEKA
jgi:hypothetical protein